MRGPLVRDLFLIIISNLCLLGNPNINMHVEGGGMYITCCDVVVYYQFFQTELVHLLCLGRDLVGVSYVMTLIYPPFFLDVVVNPSPALASGSRVASLDRRDRSRSPVNPQGRSRSSTTVRTTPRRIRRSNRGQGNP